MEYHLTLPCSISDIKEIYAGDIVYLSGLIVTGRDQVHKRILEYVSSKRALPPEFNKIKGSAIYHMGPIVAKDADSYRIISGGPTTSSRMNPFQSDVNRILDLRFVIGKGGMSGVDWNGTNCLYLQFPGGAGAIASKLIKNVSCVVWDELGPESAWFLEIEEFGPLVVAIDLHGKNLYLR